MMAAIAGVVDPERIVAFARRFPVFPCAHNKRPRVANGFHAASQDPAQIRAWWRQWPDSLVAVPTGQGTTLVVIDYDPDKATQATHAWIAEHTDLLCSTRTHKTGRGGLHYLFTSRDRYQTGVDLVLDGSPRKGIDLRANGGYVIWWPFHTGDNPQDAIGPLPANLIDERKFVERRDMAPLPSASPEDWRREHERVQAALAHLAPDGYEFWIRVGMALHHASGGSDEGFAAWHEWSARGESYDGIEDCRYHWNSFGGYSGRALGLGTVYAAAKTAGWSPARALPEPPEMELPPIEAYADDAPAKPHATSGGAQIALRPIHSIVAEQREAEWLLYRVLEARVLAVLAGPRGTFKSFIALEWAMRCAVAGHGVVLLSGEGAGLDRRVDAWRRAHRPELDLTALNMTAVERPVNLRLAIEIAALSAAIGELARPPALIVVDTFSKFSAGIDENDNGEVSAYLAGLVEFLRDEFGATVLLVAHSGHGDDKRPRGASALMANPDAEYIVQRVPNSMTVTVTRERFKDSPSLEALSYEAKSIDLGRYDSYGEPVTSLALVSAAPPPRALRQPTGRAQRQILAGLRNLQKDSSTRLLWSVEELRAIARAGGLSKATARSAVEALALSGFLQPIAGGGYALRKEEADG